MIYSDAQPPDLPFWSRQCPARGFGLTHMFLKNETPGRCTHCGATPNAPTVMVWLSHTTRDANEQPAHQGALQDGPIEPKMANGYVTGPEGGPGRGAFTGKQLEWYRKLRDRYAASHQAGTR